jgi:hypothetical protein
MPRDVNNFLAAADRQGVAPVEARQHPLHKQLRVHPERYPLSVASHFRGSGHDLDIYALGKSEVPLAAEVKARTHGAGFTTLEKWLDGHDALFLRRNGADSLVVVPWRGEARR